MPDLSDPSFFHSVRQCIAAIRRGLAAHGGPEVAEVLSRLAGQRLENSDFTEPQPRHLPVLRYFPECIGRAMLVEPTLAAGLAAIEEHLSWRQTSAYTDAVLGEGFTANYGWAELIGPRGFFPGDDFLLGLLMLGPDRHYRDHHHPAPEIYWPLTSGSQWRAAPEDFAGKPAGAIIWHHPYQVHATQTGSSPLLTIWAWTRDTGEPARLVDQA